MPISKNPLCIAAFAQEFESRGVRAHEAISLASKLLVQHPIRSRKTLDKLARDFTRRGVAAHEANSLAWSILAYQQLDAGTPFGELLHHLQSEGLSYEQAVEASLTGSKIERRLKALASDEDEYEEIEIPIELLLLALTAMALIAIVLSSL